MRSVERVVIVGRGGAGKLTLAARLSEVTHLPVVALDELFWQPGLVACPPDRWNAIQHEVTRRDRWIIDGDLGPHDVLDLRLQAADTVIMLDFSVIRCAWRTPRRGHERADYWRWLWGYRRRSRPSILAAIATHAPRAELHVLRNLRAVERFLAEVSRRARVST